MLAGVRHHHERGDGAGYPDGVSGAEIPLSARIIAVADAYDAMANERPYHEALPHHLIVAELRRCADRQFDPDLVKEFLTILETGVCELDPDLIAEAVTQATAPVTTEPISSL